MIHITQAHVDLLAAAVNECDTMMLAEERRAEEGLQMRDRNHHYDRQRAMRGHRKNLIELYVKITGRDPWKDIPF